MKDWARFYYFVESFPARIIRLCFFLFPAYLLFQRPIGGEKFLFVILGISIMLEIFIDAKVRRMHPSLFSKKTTLYDKATIPALKGFLKGTSFSAVTPYISNSCVLYLLEKIGITAKEIPTHTFSQKDVLAKSEEVVKERGGLYITSVDVVAAYLLLTENESKLLFSKEIAYKDFLYLVGFITKLYPNEENPRPFLTARMGSGIGYFLTVGWTYETAKYTQDITLSHLSEQSFSIGREVEFGQLITRLSQRTKNNVLLVGGVGSGKLEMIRAFIEKSYFGQLQDPLNNTRVYELLVDALVSETKTQGDLESRMRSIIEEVAHSGNVVLYIPEIQNIMGASTFGLNLTGILLPYLENGAIKIIASVTPENYKKYVEPVKSFTEMFGIISLHNPTPEQVLAMVLSKTTEIEKENRCTITLPAVKEAIMLSKQYTDAIFPGSAIVLLEDAAHILNKKFILATDIQSVLETKTGIPIGMPKREEQNKLLHLEEILHRRVIGQDKAVTAVSEAMKRMRTGLTSPTRPVSFLFLGPTGVGKTETAKALAFAYFGNESAMIRLDMSEYTTTDSVRRLLGATAGEGDEKGELTEAIRDNPFSLVLLDELEKAHPSILNLFLQVLEDGRLTDNKGKTVNFTHTIIIATSNATSSYIHDLISSTPTISDSSFQEAIIKELKKEDIFKPELLNRFDSIIVFHPLSEREAGSVSRNMIAEIVKGLDDKGITVHIDESIYSFIAKKGYDPEFGARPMRRSIQDLIEDAIADELVKGTIQRGDSILLTVENDHVTVKKTN